MVSLRRTRLRELVASGRVSAKAVRRLRESPERFFATVQIGITVIGVAAGALGGASYARKLEPVLRRVPFLAPYADELAFALVVSLVSYLSLVLGELVPKSLALRASERYSLLIGRPLLWLSLGTRPLVAFLTASSNLVLRLFGDRTSFIETRLSSEELQEMVREAASAGTVHRHAGQIAARALQFAELTAEDVMVPRNRVIAVRKSASPDQVHRTFLEHSHTRMPVYDANIDDVVGYVTVKDVLEMLGTQSRLEDRMRPPFFVPESKPAVDLLQEMRQRRVSFAIIVDERGGMAGIITLEDLVEELVGEIFSEHVHHVPELFKVQPDGSALVVGTVAVRDLNRELALELPEEGEWTTVAGLCLALAGRIPQRGERVVTPNGYVLEITDASPRRVRQVRVYPREAVEPTLPEHRRQAF